LKREGKVTDEYNFDEIYDTFWPKIHIYVVRMVGENEADDLTQEIFIKVGKSVESFRNESELYTWIYSIATNTVIDRMRKSDYLHETKQNDVNLNIQNEQNSCIEKEALAIEGQVINREMNKCIREHIDALPEKLRTVIVLSEMEGLKNKDIAEVLGITLEAVKTRIHRAKIYLKNELEHHCDFYWDERNEMACGRKKQ
jgi:RNA polymerase sigma-70 factor (ECF subfamily)